MSEIVTAEPNNEKEKKETKNNQKQLIRWHGKDIEMEKLQKKMSHKPRILGTLLINLTIIIVIIIIILLAF
jgi:hypothetical protein